MQQHREPGSGRVPFADSHAGRRPSVYERLKQAILAGELQPGQPLVEAAIAEWCEVSRTPVREALNRLEHDGMIVRADRGLIVKESSPDEILDLYETRIVLEATAARVAAERRISHDVIRMRQLCVRLDSVDTTDPVAMAAGNAEFHRAVWRASHNESLIDLLERLSLHLGRYPATTLAYPGRWEAAGIEHRRLVDAIDRRDGQLASTIATDHFTAARDIRLRLWAEEDLEMRTSAR